MNIDDALARFQVQLDADGRSRHTRDQYARHVRTLAGWLAPDNRIEKIDHEALARFLASPAARTRRDGRAKRATSTNCLRSSLRGFFSYCAAAGLIDRDPSRLIRRARCGSASPRTLSEEDQRRLLHVLRQEDGERDFVLFSLMLGTGIRVSSAVALDVEDVDLEQAQLWLRTTKGDRPDRVFFGSALREILGVYLAGRRSGPLFPGRGMRLTTRHVARRLRHWLGRAGIERRASPHTLRHTFAVHALERTGDLFAVKEALCHRSVVSTIVYLRSCRDRARQAILA